MKIVTVVGARPQFIKASAFSRRARENGISEILVHTGQHYDDNMSAVFFKELEIDLPAYNLGVQASDHGAMTGRQLEGVERVLLNERPDLVLVYGDTNSTLAGALAAVKLHIPVAHVEAGLRSFNRRMPEEINRCLTDHISTWLFTPTTVATENLRREGIDARKTHQVGDIMYDVALFFGDRARSSTILSDQGIEGSRYAVATVHRAENTDDPQRLSAIFAALVAFSDRMPVVIPLHPRTLAALKRQGIESERLTNLKILPPLGYLDMTRLLQGAALVATDSGGLQKEAFFHKVPCVTLRDETEWQELVDLGWNRLPSQLTTNSIMEAFDQAMTETREPKESPYGSGDAAIRIISVLKR